MKHKHHIIPKHVGGTDDSENLILLSVPEHAEAHRLLYEQYGRWQDRIAWLALSGMIGKEEIIHLVQSEAAKNKIITEEYRENMRIAQRKVKHGPLSEKHKTNIANSLCGTKRTREQRKNMTLAQMGNKNNLGHKHKPETIQKMRNAKLGKKFSETHIENLRLSHLGQKSWNKGNKQSREDKNARRRARRLERKNENK